MDKLVTTNQCNFNLTQDDEEYFKLETDRSLANSLNKSTDLTTKNPKENKLNHIENKIHEVHPNIEKNKPDTISQNNYTQFKLLTYY